MNSYYKVLGIEEGADKNAIKKAYFKAIRKCPPDKEPEQFKKIREAYDFLMNDDNRKVLERKSAIDPAFHVAYQQVLEYMKQKDYKNGIDCCQEVLKISKIEEFQILLAVLYEKNDNPGKAIKVYEELVRKYPQKIRYLAGLGHAYYQRSWYKKAYTTLKQSWDRGYVNEPLDIEYYFTYASVSMELNQWEQGRAILLEAIRRFREEEHGSKLAELNDIWFALFKGILMSGCRNLYLEKDLEAYIFFVKSQGAQAEELLDSMIAIPNEICERGNLEDEVMTQLKGLLQWCGHQTQTGAFDKENLTDIMGIRYRLEFTCMSEERRIDREVKEAFQNIYSMAIPKFMADNGDSEYMWGEYFDEEEYRCAVLDLELSIIDDWKTAKELMVILKEEYPLMRELLGDFVDEVLQETNKNHIWKKYEKLFRKAMGYPSTGNIVKADPEKIVHDSAEEGTYHRDTPKVGRNDPCPCGSGKKYKQCCGKNA